MTAPRKIDHKQTCGHCMLEMRGFAAKGDIYLCHPDTGLDCYQLVTRYRHSLNCQFCIWRLKYSNHNNGGDNNSGINSPVGMDMIFSIVTWEPWILHRPVPCENVRCVEKQWCIGCDPHGLYGCKVNPWPCGVAMQNPLWKAARDHTK